MTAVTATVRRAGVSDAAAIAELAAATFPLACPPQTPPEHVAEYVRTHCTPDVLRGELTTDGTVIYVADAEEGLVGYATLIAGAVPPADVPGHRPVELKRIYVAEEHHGSGVAGALMDECVHHARTDGYDLMWLGTNQLNHRALAFYERHGFSIVGARTFTVGGSVEDDHVLARPLDS